MMFLAPATQFVALLAEAAEKEQIDTNKVSPGVGGFVVIALLAIALFFLGLDLVRRVRRAKFRAEIHEELAAEIAERDAANPAGSTDISADLEPNKGGAEADDADPRAGKSD